MYVVKLYKNDKYVYTWSDDYKTIAEAEQAAESVVTQIRGYIEVSPLAKAQGILPHMLNYKIEESRKYV
jgi:hypothetical protein